MNIILDIEANSLTRPTQIWCIVCKDIDTGSVHVFREVTSNEAERDRFLAYIKLADMVVGHNLLGYDWPVMADLLPGLCTPPRRIDSLIVSRLVDYSRVAGHSLAAYGTELGLEKIEFNDWTKWSQEMEDYCVRDVEISLLVYRKYHGVISNSRWRASLDLEHDFQLVVNSLHRNGFAFNQAKATTLLTKVEAELKVLDEQILSAFPPRLKLIREVTPRATKYGTISKTSIPRSLHPQIENMGVDCPFSYCGWHEFNPASHKQVVDVLNDARWRPVDKTQSHIDTERAINSLKRRPKTSLDLLTLEDYSVKLKHLAIYGWKINENNLGTLPAKAPKPARLLAQRILYESRRRTLTEWSSLVQEDGRIHGKFVGIGAWTHRMAHQKPNTANIPNEFDTNNKKKLLGKELRSLWQAPPRRLLAGVDAEGIQLRIFAHYVNDPELTEALVKGKKHDKTDPHSLNQRVIGNVCKSRQAAKRYIYALFLGAGMQKLSQILECSAAEAEQALDSILQKYPGFEKLKSEVFPNDAKRGWFEGLDGRKVLIPDQSVSGRKHLAMSGYLQNGEAIVMKRATLKWEHQLDPLSAKLVNLVHDEWQVEVPNDLQIALKISEMMADSLRQVGEDLGLKCPLAGSYWNDDAEDYTIGSNWSVTH